MRIVLYAITIWEIMCTFWNTRATDDRCGPSPGALTPSLLAPEAVERLVEDARAVATGAHLVEHVPARRGLRRPAKQGGAGREQWADAPCARTGHFALGAMPPGRTQSVRLDRLGIDLAHDVGRGVDLRCRGRGEVHTAGGESGALGALGPGGLQAQLLFGPLAAAQLASGGDLGEIRLQVELGALGASRVERAGGAAQGAQEHQRDGNRRDHGYRPSRLVRP